MARVRLGIVGTGTVWEYCHFPIIKELDELYTVTALTARRDESKAKWSKLIPGASMYTDYRDLLADKDVDAVVVATPIELNHVVTQEALAAGKHVFVEKPIAVNYIEAKKIAKLEKRTGKKTFMLEQSVYYPWFSIVKNIVDQKRYGEAVVFEVLHHINLSAEDGSLGRYAQKKWRINPKYPLGTLLDAGTHDIARITSLFGIPESVYARGAKFRKDMGQFDHVLMIFGYAGMLSGFYSHGSYMPKGNNYFNIRFEQASVYVKDDCVEIDRRSTPKEIIGFEKSNPYFVMWKELAQDYFEERDGVFSSVLAAQSMAVFDAVADSVNGNRCVYLRAGGIQI